MIKDFFRVLTRFVHLNAAPKMLTRFLAIKIKDHADNEED